MTTRYSIARIEKKLKKNSCRADDRMVLLRRWMTAITFGSKTKEGVRPDKTIRQAQSYSDTFGGAPIPNYRLRDHFDGQATHYYFSDPDAEELLLMVDVDCHHKGSPEGALAYTRHIDRKFFGGKLYHEPSTNGKGRHGYVRLQRTDSVQATVAHLTKVLRAEIGTHDIELVEIKGTPVKVQWVKGKRQITGYGQFAKIPRLKTTQDADRLAATTLLTADRIMAWAAPPVQRTTSTGTGSADWWTERDGIRLHNLTVWARGQKLDGMKTSGRHVVCAQDVACLLLVVSKLGERMGDDDPMRSKRIKGLWSKLYEQGHLPRGWDGSRVKVLRDTLSERGLIDWQDNSYTPPEDGEGRAMVWRLGDELQDLVSTSATPVQNTHTTPVSTDLLLRGQGEYLTPCRVWRLKTTARIHWEPTEETDQWAAFMAA